MLNGILLVDKPMGWTSHDVVGKVRRLLGTRAVGHCGTLDPMASGLLILLLGPATKLSDYLLSQDKSYRTKIQLGVETDSHDITGEVVRQSEVDLSQDMILSQLQKHVGELRLPVPVFSATKVNGKKLYESARRGQKVEPPIKTMRFYNMKLHEVGPNFVDVAIDCSKGSYIRAWGHSIGQALGVGGALASLRRTQSGPWHVDQALSLEDLERLTVGVAQESWPTVLGQSYVEAAQALPHMKWVVADGREERLVSNGQIPHSVSSRLIHEQKLAITQEGPVGIRLISKQSGSLLAILEATPHRGLRLRRVFKSIHSLTQCKDSHTNM